MELLALQPEGFKIQVLTPSLMRSNRDKGRDAETALLAPIAAGETPLNELHPAAIATIVQALRHVGEDFSARLFAMETAIAYGL